MSEKYLANRLKYHAASRIASQQGEALLQALTLDGHTVGTSKVWASSRFVENTADWKRKKDGAGATADLVAVFKALPGVKSEPFNGGTVWRHDDYDVELYENVTMTAVTDSNGLGNNYEAYEILDATGARLQDWVSPMAAFDKTINAPIPGYTGIFQSKAASGSWSNLQEQSYWVLADGTWEFAYLGGMLTFNADFTPEGKSRPNIRMTAFRYCGKYLDAELSGITANVNIVSGVLSGYNTVGAVKAADDALDLRLDAVESQLGLGGNSGNVGSITERVVEIEKTISAYTSDNTISGAITAEVAARIAADGVLQTQVDAISAFVSGLPADIDYISGVVSNLPADIDYISGVVSALPGKIDTQIKPKLDAVDGRIDIVSAALTGEISTRANAITLVTKALTEQISARTDADSALQALIDEVSGKVGVIDSKTISGVDAINVSTNTGNSVVSLKINPNDRFLSQSADGLSAAIGFRALTDIDAPEGVASGNIASQYALVDAAGNIVGDRISIYKDQFLKSASYSETTKKITLEFNTADNTVTSTYIDLSGLVDTYLAGDGIAKVAGPLQDDGTATQLFKVKLNAASEAFLTVGADGVRLSGVQAAIDAAVAVETTLRTNDVEELSAAIDFVSGAVDDEVVRAKAAEQALSTMIGTSEDTSADETVYGAMAELLELHTNECNIITGRVAVLEALLGNTDPDDPDATIAQKVRINTVNIATVSGMAVTNADNIASNDADIAVLSSNLATVSGDLSTVSGNLATVSGDLSTLSTNVVTNYATKSELSATADDIRDEVDMRFTNMNDGMDEINTRIDALNVKILALSGNN